MRGHVPEDQLKGFGWNYFGNSHTNGLLFSYYGGRYETADGTSQTIDDGDVDLVQGVNYIELDWATGEITANQTGFTPGACKLWQVDTLGGRYAEPPLDMRTRFKEPPAQLTDATTLEGHPAEDFLLIADLANTPPPANAGPASTTGSGTTVARANHQHGAATELKTTGSEVTIGTAAPPSKGQVLTALSDMEAEWQDPVGDSGGRYDADASSGLSYAYTAGSVRSGGDVAVFGAGTVTLLPSLINYVQLQPDGVVITDDTAFLNGNAPLARVTTSATAITLVDESPRTALIAGAGGSGGAGLKILTFLITAATTYPLSLTWKPASLTELLFFIDGTQAVSGYSFGLLGSKLTVSPALPTGTSLTVLGALGLELRTDTAGAMKHPMLLGTGDGTNLYFFLNEQGDEEIVWLGGGAIQIRGTDYTIDTSTGVRRLKFLTPPAAGVTVHASVATTVLAGTDAMTLEGHSASYFAKASDLGGVMTGNAVSIQGTAVDPTAPASGQTLVFDGTKWAPGGTSGNATSIQGKAVSGTAPASQEVLYFNGTQWVPTRLSTAALSDYTSATNTLIDAKVTGLKDVANGFPTLDSGLKLAKARLPNLASTDLNDVSPTGLGSGAGDIGKVLIWDGSKYTPGTINATSLGFSLSGATLNQVLAYNGTAWAPLSLTTAKLSDYTTATNTLIAAEITRQQSGTTPTLPAMSNGVILSSQLPALAITNTFTRQTLALRDALTGGATPLAQTGDVCVVTDPQKSYIMSATTGTGTAADWTELQSPTGGITTLTTGTGLAATTQTGPAVTVTAAMIQAAEFSHTHDYTQITGLTNQLGLKADLAHTHQLNQLRTNSNTLLTGTPDSTTFLRGDGSWATPAGSAGSSGIQSASVASWPASTAGNPAANTVSISHAADPLFKRVYSAHKGITGSGTSAILAYLDGNAVNFTLTNTVIKSNQVTLSENPAVLRQLTSSKLVANTVPGSNPLVPITLRPSSGTVQALKFRFVITKAAATGTGSGYAGLYNITATNNATSANFNLAGGGTATATSTTGTLSADKPLSNVVDGWLSGLNTFSSGNPTASRGFEAWMYTFAGTSPQIIKDITIYTGVNTQNPGTVWVDFELQFSNDATAAVDNPINDLRWFTVALTNGTTTGTNKALTNNYTTPIVPGPGAGYTASSYLTSGVIAAKLPAAISTDSWTAITNVTPTIVHATGTTDARYAVSFDGCTTWEVYDGLQTKWVTLSNGLTSLAISSNVTTGMTAQQLATIPSTAAPNATGWQLKTLTGSLGLAVYLQTNNASYTPILSKIDVFANAYGGYQSMPIGGINEIAVTLYTTRTVFTNNTGATISDAKINVML